MSIKVWGTGDFADGDSKYNPDIYTTIEAIGVNDKVAPPDTNRPTRNLYEILFQVYKSLESFIGTTMQTNGVFEDALVSAFVLDGDLNKDIVSVDLDGTYKHYARLTPGIAFCNGNMAVNSPQVHIAERQIAAVLQLDLNGQESVTITYDYDTDKYEGEIIKKDVVGVPTTYTYNNSGNGYDSGVALLEAMYNESTFTSSFSSAIGTDLTIFKIEPVVEVSNATTYYWIVDASGDFVCDTSAASGDSELGLTHFTVTIAANQASSGSEGDDRAYLAISSAVEATPNTLALRDSTGRTKVLYPSNNGDAVNKGYIIPKVKAAYNLSSKDLNLITSRWWSIHSLPVDLNFLDICWSPELKLFCAGGGNPALGDSFFVLSSDGINWEKSTTAVPKVYKIAWSPELGMFCAVGDDKVYTSSDGFTWSTSIHSDLLTGVVWSPELGIFCAVGYSGDTRVITSPDGITWTERNAAVNSGWQGLTWSPELGIFCAVAGTGDTRVMTSPDGITWTPRNAAANNDWYAITWSPELSLFCSVGETGTNRVMTSPDGITWTERSATEAAYWYGVTWSPELGIFCAVSFNATNKVMISKDGINWTSRKSSFVAQKPIQVAWSPELGMFCAVGYDGFIRSLSFNEC